jgi:hypothetical protein
MKVAMGLPAGFHEIINHGGMVPRDLHGFRRRAACLDLHTVIGVFDRETDVPEAILPNWCHERPQKTE